MSPGVRAPQKAVELERILGPADKHGGADRHERLGLVLETVMGALFNGTATGGGGGDCRGG